MLAKTIVHADNREEALLAMTKLLESSKICGPVTNLDFVLSILRAESFQSGRTLTNFLDDFEYSSPVIEVLSGGAYTLVQDQGRPQVGHGIPRSGAMDPLAHELANILVGNEHAVETLEITLSGPELYFHSDAVIAVTGAEITASIGGTPLTMWARHVVKKHQKLKIGKVFGNGCRSYLGVYGGFLNVATYFGSKSTTPFIGIGGYQGRQLAPGDLLQITQDIPQTLRHSFTLPDACIPHYENDWILDILPGPYSDNFLLPEDLDMVYGTRFTVTHNASRAGIRLTGPAPKWARSDGQLFQMADSRANCAQVVMVAHIQVISRNMDIRWEH